MSYVVGSSITAVIVSYNPSLDLYENIKKIASQVKNVIIFDNNSLSKENVNKCEVFLNVDIIYSDRNIGLSRAQNICISKAINQGADWVLTLDDDSDITSDYIEKMLTFYNSSPVKDSIGALVPSVYDVNSQKYSKFIHRRRLFSRRHPTSEAYPVLVAIASGMLVRSDVFNTIGAMDHDFFIDYVDIDFCLRLNQSFSIYVVPTVVLKHRLGDKKKIEVLGGSFYVSNHNSFRRYYIYRNRITVWRRNAWIYPTYVLYDFCVSFIEATKIIVFESSKRKNFVAIIKGISDGLLGK